MSDPRSAPAAPASVPRHAPAAVPTARFAVHAALAIGGSLAAVLLRAPALVVLVSPSIVMLAIDLMWRPDADLQVRIRPSADRLVEGDITELALELTSTKRTSVEVTLGTSGPLTSDDPPAWRVVVGPHEPVEVAVTATGRRWGAAIVGPVRWRFTAPCGLFAADRTGGQRHVVRVLPRPTAASQLVRPSRTHLAAGNRTSTARGSGTEFAELRPFVPGDRPRDLNWRVSARRGAPWIAERHPERRTDVVLLLDAYDADQLDAVLEAALGLAQSYLADHDRVGVTTLGGVMRWVEPGTGIRQEHRIADALLDSQVSQSFVAPAVTSLPPRALPPGALVLGLTPGSDRRLPDAAVGLRAQGRDVAVIVLDPPPVSSEERIEVLADRLTRLERRAVRDRLHTHGVPAVAWDPSGPVDAALTELQRWRRRPVRVR